MSEQTNRFRLRAGRYVLAKRETAERLAPSWPTWESLELMLEAAWLKLPRAFERGAPWAVYLSQAGVIVGGPTIQPDRGTLVGFYDQRVTLAQFREDVFEENAKIRGRQ